MKYLIAALTVFLSAFAQSSFQSQWHNQPDRIWTGPEYWAGPLQSWRIRNGRVESLEGKGRTLHLLTWQPTATSDFTTEVTVGRAGNARKGAVGMQFGVKGKINEYRHNCIWGKGTIAGIHLGGALFIGKKTAKVKFAKEVTLKLKVSKGEAILIAMSGGKTVGRVQAKLPDGASAGNIALFSDGGKQRGGTAPLFYFKNWSLKGANLKGGPQQNWGPILWSQYTLSRKILKLTAQMVPIGPKDPKQVTMEVQHNGAWTKVGSATIDPLSRTATFRVANWDDAKDTPYRINYALATKSGSEACQYTGTIRKDPVDKQTVSIAGFTGNKDEMFPNTHIANNVAKQNPDVLFFSGDQLYENVARYGITRTPTDVAALDYLRKWYLVGWAFGNLLKDRPSVFLVDDHDVYQGNVWGHGGRKLPGKAFSLGGYIMDPKWVNTVHRTQCSHLPDPFDPTPIKQGISVYYTDMVYGRVSFAIVADRMWKWGPNSKEAKATPEKAQLYGPRQLKFLRHWAGDWAGHDMKMVLQATVLATCHNQHSKQINIRKGKAPIGSADSNSWPQAGRRRALAEIRRGFGFMYAGDSHLANVVQLGIDDWGDAGFCFTVPSISAGFQRAWVPAKPGRNRKPGMPDYCGDYVDAHGSRITFYAVGNPLGRSDSAAGDLKVNRLKGSGYGMVYANKTDRTYRMECWRINADISNPKDQFPGWPITIKSEDNYARKAKAWLPTIQVTSMTNPVVQVIDSAGLLVYALRIRGTTFQPKVFAAGTYTVKVGEQPGNMKTFKGVKTVDKPGASTLKVEF